MRYARRVSTAPNMVLLAVWIVAWVLTLTRKGWKSASSAHLAATKSGLVLMAAIHARKDTSWTNWEQQRAANVRSEPQPQTKPQARVTSAKRENSRTPWVARAVNNAPKAHSRVKKANLPANHARRASTHPASARILARRAQRGNIRTPSAKRSASLAHWATSPATRARSSAPPVRVEPTVRVGNRIARAVQKANSKMKKGKRELQGMRSWPVRGPGQTGEMPKVLAWHRHQRDGEFEGHPVCRGQVQINRRGKNLRCVLCRGVCSDDCTD